MTLLVLAIICAFISGYELSNGDDWEFIGYALLALLCLLCHNNL